MHSSRRSFLSGCAGCAALMALPRSGAAADLSQHEARHWRALDKGEVLCGLCPWHCQVAPGKTGQCQVRKNIDGRYVSLVYGRIAARHTDPIEKKPFYHFMPGARAFSMATAGCNVDCSFCQNWTLARRPPSKVPNVYMPPEKSVEASRAEGVPVMAYTYNEPTIQQEYVTDTARLARVAGIKTVMISNGFIETAPLKELCGLVDAYKIDLKAFSESYYKDVVHGMLKPVLRTLTTLKEAGVWTEIVYLVVPGMNDSKDEIIRMVAWIKDNLGCDVPLHFSRFVPQYRLQHLPPTPVATLEKLRMEALEGGLHYVYLGNVPGHDGANTYCPGCHKMLVQRVGYRIYENHILQGKCRFCSESIAGVWTDPVKERP